jgi:hypothetical protein
VTAAAHFIIAGGAGAPDVYIHINPVYSLYHHLGPPRDGYSYPYPDFLQAIYHVETGVERPDARVHDPYVVRTAFCPLTTVEALPLRSVDRVFLRAALSERAGR